MIFIFLCTTLLFANQSEEILKLIENSCLYSKNYGLKTPLEFNHRCQSTINKLEHEIILKDTFDEFTDETMRHIVAGAQHAEVSLQCEANTYDNLHTGLIVKFLSKTGYGARYATAICDAGLGLAWFAGVKHLEGIAGLINAGGFSIIGIGWIASCFDNTEWQKQIRSNHYAAQKFAERAKEHHMHYHKFQHPTTLKKIIKD